MRTSEPPHDPLAEQSVIGSLLLSNHMIPEVVKVIGARDFYRPNHGTVYTAIIDLFTAGEPVDPVTVSAELERRGELARVGGGKMLLDAISAVPSPLNATYYAQLVADKSKLRRLAELGSRLINVAYTDNEDADAVLGQAETFFREAQEPADHGALLADIVEEWRTYQENPDDIISTPWPDLNHYLAGGLRRGKLYVVGGRPGGGKSMCGLNIVGHVAQNDLPVTVFSLEMGKLEVTSRLLAWGGWADYGQIFSKKMTQENLRRVNDYVDGNASCMKQLEVIDRASITVEEIAAHLRQRKPAVCFIDYCQLISASDNKLQRREQIDHITRTLKITAGDVGCAIILASQLNRGPTSGAGRAPILSDLRESGGIENDADVVLLLFREEHNEGFLHMNIGKNRDGKLAQLTFAFRGDVARIGDG